jgi:hypothetical protein
MDHITGTGGMFDPTVKWFAIHWVTPGSVRFGPIFNGTRADLLPRISANHGGVRAGGYFGRWSSWTAQGIVRNG